MIVRVDLSSISSSIVLATLVIYGEDVCCSVVFVVKFLTMGVLLYG